MKILQTIKNNIPNAITCLNLVSGVIACIYAFNSTVNYNGLYYGYQCAFIMIAMAAVFDFFDGLVARLIHATSAIGKELDSLCDSVSFGLAPALLVFQMMEFFNPGTPWKYAALLIAVCGVLRLARFNVDTTQSVSFLGMPIPANAIFWIGFCSVQYSAWNATGAEVPIFGSSIVIALTLVMSYMMVSSLRMFSLKFKDFSFGNNWHRYLIIIAAIAFVAVQGVSGLASTILLYIILSVFTHKHTKEHEA